MLGRLFGLSTALATAGAPLGLAVGGFLVEGVGLRATIAGMAAASAAVALWMWLDPALRGMDAPARVGADRPREEGPVVAADSARGPREED
ncbi:hypothetical protein GBA63_08300 [Rubrobacter tropicus]|uniref:MFS transporter n=1 Tax=Rubrobacter tropicus TaxID=2653851 RepID=A0A6G8Q879_9ACTN|nr:hypothetical protein [Rubrobacter tropicus]QIN82642.1 hypothetical protein GBA63_08300 [Rubrobacter tropicus]